MISREGKIKEGLIRKIIDEKTTFLKEMRW